MAKNISLMGAIFPDVPSIKLPQQEGGLVSYDDTSDATATAEDIAQGKTAYVNGEKITGTSSGGGGGQTIYTSSTGLLYTPIMTIDISMEQNNGYEIGTTLGRYGSMPYLEELTLTGIIRNSRSGRAFPESRRFSVDNYPLLKKLVIAPTEVRNGSGSEYDPSDTKYNKITFGHYVFKNTNLTHLTIGKIGGPFFDGGGYYRDDLPVPPGTSRYEIGSLDGLEITLYTDTYRQNAGWTRGVAPNTTAIQRDYITGEVLTS